MKSFFDQKLRTSQSNALTLALLLAENEALKRSVEELNEERGYKILSNSLQVLQKYTQLEDVRAQVINKDLTIFARSWDREFVGMPLEGFRKDLTKFKQDSPKVGIETGRLLTIKATAPLKRGYKTIGFVEIIAFFEPLVKSMRRLGIETVVLMKNRYLDVATLMRQNPQIDGYVVSNRNANRLILKNLEKVSLQRLQRDEEFFDGSYLYIYKPMFDRDKKEIGMFVLVIPKEQLGKFETAQNLSFFLAFKEDEFSKLIDLWERPEGKFRYLYDRRVLEFLALTKDRELKKEFEDEAREILQNYSKAELIDLIIAAYKREKKQGEIR